MAVREQTADAEAIMVAALKADAGLAAVVGTRIYSMIPSTPTFPLVRINRVGGGPVRTHPLWLDRARLQIDCYGATKTEARSVTAAVITALPLIPGSHTKGVVTHASLDRDMYLADDVYTPPMPRYILDVSLFTHPQPT